LVSGRGKKNDKTLDLVLGSLFTLVIRRSVQGSDCFILANDAGQAGDDLALAKKLISVNPSLAAEIEVRSNELRLREGSASLQILPANDTLGAHGKSAAFIGFDEIHGYRDWSLMEALQPDPTRADALQWITSYASLYDTAGAPLHDLMQIGKAGTDKRMLFSWYSGDLCTDPNFAELPPEQRANPSMGSWPEGMGYIEQQRTRLPSGRFRRLHLNLPGSPEGAAFDQANILACVVVGRRSLPYEPGRRYFAAVDMSGGTHDNACLCIGHLEGGIVVIDLVVKQIGRVPFNPRDAVRHFARIMKEYKINVVTGDAFAGQTHPRDFLEEGIRYVVRSTSASELYELLEPRLNAHVIQLPDQPAVIEELVGLVWKGSKITHENNSHDDHANVVALAVDLVLGKAQPLNVAAAVLAQARMPMRARMKVFFR
jgi:hypothetical protein